MTSLESKKKLAEGNERYVAGKSAAKELTASRRNDLADNGQKPFVLILCCSDSRVPPELVFDQGLGELFVVRTAGNVVDEVCLGSIEYGVMYLHIPLLVVLGHENCGAVRAAVDGGEVHGQLQAVVKRLAVSVAKTEGAKDRYKACEDENILHIVDEIKGNPVVKDLIRKGKLEVKGAKYGIHSGKVTFF